MGLTITGFTASVIVTNELVVPVAIFTCPRAYNLQIAINGYKRTVCILSAFFRRTNSIPSRIQLKCRRDVICLLPDEFFCWDTTVFCCVHPVSFQRQPFASSTIPFTLVCIIVHDAVNNRQAFEDFYEALVVRSKGVRDGYEVPALSEADAFIRNNRNFYYIYLCITVDVLGT